MKTRKEKKKNLEDETEDKERGEGSSLLPTGRAGLPFLKGQVTSAHVVGMVKQVWTESEERLRCL